MEIKFKNKINSNFLLIYFVMKYINNLFNNFKVFKNIFFKIKLIQKLILKKDT